MSDSNSNQNEITHDEAVKMIAGIIRDVKFAMVTTTTDKGHLHARPLTTQQKEYDGDLWFLATRDSDAVADMKARPQVNVSFSNPDKQSYVSLNGAAELVEDKAKLDELWHDMYKAYFEGGKDDPNIQIIKINAHGAEFWQGEGKVRSILQIAKGLVTRQQADLGKSGTVNL